jgi:hypothetical protein
MWSPCALLLLLGHSYQSLPGFDIHVLVACVWCTCITVFMKSHTYSNWDWFKFEIDYWILCSISHQRHQSW